MRINHHPDNNRTQHRLRQLNKAFKRVKQHFKKITNKLKHLPSKPASRQRPPQPVSIVNIDPAVHYHTLNPSHYMYQKIQSMITNDNFVIEYIEEVHNSYLKAQYGLKEEEKRREFGGRVHEELLFHGTRHDNIDSICKYNFDWRLYGSNRGHKYGKGVSFARNAMYSSNYSDPNYFHKVMIVAKVLIAKSHKGHPEMEYPPIGFDTSQNENGTVIVKYDDNEYYPAYKLYYHFRDEDFNRRYNNYNNYNYNNNYYGDNNYNNNYFGNNYFYNNYDVFSYFNSYGYVL